MRRDSVSRLKAGSDFSEKMDGDEVGADDISSNEEITNEEEVRPTKWESCAVFETANRTTNYEI